MREDIVPLPFIDHPSTWFARHAGSTSTRFSASNGHRSLATSAFFESTEGHRPTMHRLPAGTLDWNLAIQTVKSPGRIRRRLGEGARMDHDKEGLLRAIDDPHLKDARPCPFCGLRQLCLCPGPVTMYRRQTYRVVCGMCSAKGPLGLSTEHAIQRWNGEKPGLANYVDESTSGPISDML